MIGRSFFWNRLVLPPWWLVAPFMLFYLFIESLDLYVEWWLKMPGGVKEFVRMRWVAVGVAAVIFAMFRVGFHPAYRPAYREWLSCTPWTVAKPLPLAPVHLIPQDAAVLGLLLLLMGTTGRELLLPAFAFLIAYHLAMAVTLLITGNRWLAYGILFCLAVAVGLLPIGAFGLVALVLVYPLTYRANLRCLARFPWPAVDTVLTGTFGVLVGRPSRPPGRRQQLGYPFQYLAPKQNAPAISLAEGTALSLLAGAWVSALMANSPDAETQNLTAAFGCFLPVLIASLARLVLYCGNYWPPISLFGRLATGRYFIRRYDWVLAAPLIAFLVLISGSFLLVETEKGRVWGMPLLLTLSFWLNLCLGPRLQVWRLTGGHRLGLGFRDRQRFAEP